MIDEIERKVDDDVAAEMAAEAMAETEPPEVKEEETIAEQGEDLTIVEEEEEEEEEAEEEVADQTPEGRIAELQEEVTSLKTRLLRARADLENFRKRSGREKQEHVKYANRKVFLELLDVIDNFDRALTAVTDPKDNFVIGVKMIQKQLMDVLGNNGVEIINAEGRFFDPYLDEAIAREHTDELEENAIMEVFQKGFRFHGQLLRPTKVKVAVKPDSAAPNQEETPVSDEE